MSKPLRPSYLAAAVRLLSAKDAVLRRLIAKVGPCRLLAHPQDTFEALVHSITYQQLNGRAAATIHARVVEALRGDVSPRRLLGTSPEKLRGAGLSANKLAAMRDLAEKCVAGVVPPRKDLEPLSDAEIIARLTEVRGIGVWTAQMFLMFRLGRPDVLPTIDFGLRKAYGLHYKKRGMPSPEALERQGRAWAPYRTVASWYLWRSLDA